MIEQYGSSIFLRYSSPSFSIYLFLHTQKEMIYLISLMVNLSYYHKEQLVSIEQFLSFYRLSNLPRNANKLSE